MANIIIGVSIAFLLPHHYTYSSKLKDLLEVLWKIIIAIPVAYMEAIEIMLKPHDYEDIVKETVKPHRTSGLIFLDIFLITFTPKTIVVKYDKRGWYEVHRICRRKPK
jgi:multicomponent Na+:H+ antiporter subunit E